MQWIHKGFHSVSETVRNHSGVEIEELLASGKKFQIQNLYNMALAIHDSARAGIPITIIGDYDADGITATAGLFLLLRELGATNIRMRLPKRFSEGYGLNEKIVDEVQSGVLITVDNGITAKEAIKKAVKKKLYVLIIDHHMPKINSEGEPDIPPAALIVDPHVEEPYIAFRKNVTPSDFKYYCGAGLVYKIAQVLLPENNPVLGQIAAFAAIATIADVVPLQGDNRNIFHTGIQQIQQKNITPGLQCIIDLLQCNNIISETDIGFKIAPMLNAPGRLLDNGAEISLQAVLAGSYSQGQILASKLQEINEIRKGLKDSAVSRAFGIIETQGLSGSNPIVLYDEETSEGIVGLVAGSVSEKYNVSSFVFTKKGSMLKGSARTAGYDNLKKSLDAFHLQHGDVLGDTYGGHKGAAGISIKTENFEKFKLYIPQYMEELHKKQDTLFYDLEITADEIIETAHKIRQFAPFGEGNPPVIVKITDFKTTPKGNSFFTELKKDSLKFRGAGCEVIGFSMADRFKDAGYPTRMDLIGTLGFRSFMGKISPQIEVIDFKPCVNKSVLNETNQSIADALKTLFS